MNKHTRGDWQATDEIFNGDELAIVAPDGTIIGTAWPQGDDTFGQEEQQANQRLMAAASKMADLLERIVADASACTSACARLVDADLIEEAEELLGKAVTA